ncbi:FAD-linked oxidase C-terminal domain-containing protein [uncultured Bilophila sp.]|uniref:FAD-binding oxidoreductase n=1 Tax=uncultured Bilophila sp. TaxID=529385 RepID=UPI00280B3279|nr:FAD-linked oxidase C-terminal domain-containing protein [uncultured Bilophila sp.]
MDAASPALTPEQRSFLEDLFKDDAVFEEGALRVYASDASLRRGPVLAMVRPRTAEQVQELLRWADAERVPIHPRGRGTSLSGGCVPTRAGVVVSMLGMDRILEISEDDFVATVEPGANTLQFQQACERKGLFYPPDPASGKATSVGGNVMTCAGGLRAVKYGVTRDYVLGMDVALPGGKRLKLGGKTHKDVIGLDLSRLFVGSEGTLGIVTKLYLKLLPKPEASASVLVGYPSLDAALSSMGNVFAAGILPCAVEFMNETVLEILTKTGDVPWPETVKSLLLFQVDGSRETVPLENARLAARLGDALWSMQGVGEDEDKLWAYRRRVSSSSYVLGPDRIGGDMAVPRGSLLKAIRRFEAIAASHGKRLIGFGHAGDGNIHANLHYDASDPDDARRTLAAHHELDAAVLEFGGSLSGEHGGGCLKDVGSQIGPDELEAMHALRRLFDPNGILNPGKGY